MTTQDQFETLFDAARNVSGLTLTLFEREVPGARDALLTWARDRELEVFFRAVPGVEDLPNTRADVDYVKTAGHGEIAVFS